MTVLLVILYILVCFFLIMVVLLQQGKGADLAGAFGGGGSQTSFGPRTGSNIMHRLTTISFVLFVVLSMTLAIMKGTRGGSVLEGVEGSAPVAEETTDDPSLLDDEAEIDEPVGEAADEPVDSPIETE